MVLLVYWKGHSGFSVGMEQMELGWRPVGSFRRIGSLKRRDQVVGTRVVGRDGE